MVPLITGGYAGVLAIGFVGLAFSIIKARGVRRPAAARARQRKAPPGWPPSCVILTPNQPPSPLLPRRARADSEE